MIFTALKCSYLFNFFKIRIANTNLTFSYSNPHSQSCRSFTSKAKKKKSRGEGGRIKTLYPVQNTMGLEF